MAYQETFVQRHQHRIYVRDHPGAEPAIILMHGFPDNVHLYDRLSPYLSPPRRVVLFDFLGWGSSDKPSGYPYTTAIKSVTSTPSSPNCGSGKQSSSRTTPRVHRPSTGRWPTPSAWLGWCC
jgi:pimeloyl-ACP methyl ester carboxylesterase